ncbi:MAG: phage portal protein [Cellvibrionaceae bacterium]
MKLNLIDRAVMALSPGRGLARVRAKALSDVITTQAGYDAAGKGRGNAWVRGSDSSQNTENRQALTALRYRHRELARNNPYVSAAIDTTVSLTVAEGIAPAARCADEDKAAQANELMLEWAHSLFADADGRLDLFGLQALIMRTETESGEGLAMRQIKRIPGVRIPLQIRVLEADYLDHLRDGNVDGRRVVQGVAFGSDNQRAGYYIHRDHPGDRKGGLSKSKFVDAADIAHVYEIQRPGQARGVPRGAAVLTRVSNLDDFQDARLRQQKVAACLAAFVTQGEDGKLQGDPLPTTIEPGMIARLSPDEAVTHAAPPSVSGQDGFIRGEEHIIARGYGLNHQALTGDITGANFAGSKIGRLEVYANVRRWRKTMLVPQFCKVVERWFLEAADLAGFDLSGVTFDWVPPRTEILNLRDDIPALIKQCRGGFGSLSGVLRSLGYPDPEAFLREYSKDLKLLDELGITLDSDPRSTTQSGQLQSAAGSEKDVIDENSNELET